MNSMVNLLFADITIITYGGGEILQKVFQAISILFNNGKGGLIQPIMIICASLGGVYAFSKAFFESVGQSLLLGYFFPLIAITSILTIPSTTVHIEDILKTSRAQGVNQTSFYSVSHVPWLLAKFSETVSTIGFRLSEGIESVMHLPNDPTYNTTGMIFGSESAMDMTKYRLSNANLEQNFKQFAKQCVIYDIALSRYGLEDIKKSTDLWNFFERKTSNVRMIRYCPPNSSLDQCTYISCKSAIQKMKPLFEKEKELYVKTEIGRHLPLTFQALTGIQKESKELIGQQLTMNALTDDLSGGKFAKNRAYLQQQSTYRTMGSLASSGLVTMRIVFEALIYAIFIFVIPLSLTPGGTKYLINWAWLVIWIQMWPPLYSILNYIMQIAAHYKFNSFLSSLAESEKGLSVFTSIGMQNLNDEIFALASFLSLSVPYISYILLKEGLSSFVQLASSLMAPAQGAASAAASELVSGNYSFANANFGQMAYNNASGMQTNFAPSVSSGYFTDNQGDISTIYGERSPIVRQSTSELRTSVFSDDAIGKNLQQQVQEAQSNMENVQQTFSNNISSASREMSDYVSHLADSNNTSQGYSERASQGVQESANYIQNIVEDFGKQYGLNTKVSGDIVLGGALSGGYNKGFFSIGASGGAHHNRSASRDEAMNAALKISESEAFQSHLQTIKDFARSDAFNSSHDEGSRRSQLLSDSIDKVVSGQDSYQNAQNRLTQASENQSWFEQNSQSIKHSLNQDFVKWASQELSCTGGFDHLKEILNDQSGMNQYLIKEFVDHYRSENDIRGFIREESNHSTSFQDKKEQIMNQYQKSTALSEEKIAKKLENEFRNEDSKELLLKKFEKTASNHSDREYEVRDKYYAEKDSFNKKFLDSDSRYLLSRILSGPDNDAQSISKKQNIEVPFWFVGGD